MDKQKKPQRRSAAADEAGAGIAAAPIKSRSKKARMLRDTSEWPRIA